MCKNSLVLLFSFILGLSLVSCNNFLKATEVKDDIEQHIAYANAKSYLVKVNSREGTGTVAKPASGEALKKETDVFEIKFEPLPDFEFVSWQASSSKLPEGQNINDYIEIEDVRKAETRVTFKKALEDIVITATVAERAQIISYSPMTSEVLKDSSVLVQFDHDMNVDSIYYTQEEIDKLKLSNQNINFIPSKRTPGRFYGYKLGDEPFYKNISFVDNETETNLTSCYDEPYFANPKMLTINTVKDKPLDDYTPILVTIDKNFFYTFDDGTEKGKSVTLTGSKKWTYQVNDQVDEFAPRFVDVNEDIKVSINAGLTDKVEITSSTTKPAISASTLFNRDRKVHLNIKLTDPESGPTDYFFIVLSRIQDGTYNDITNPVEATRSVNYQRVTSQKGLINKDVDLSTVFAEDFCDENSNGLLDGIYKMSFIFKDRSDKTMTYPDIENNYYYYFVVDNTGPSSKDVKVTSSESDAADAFKVSWTPDSKDYVKATLSYKTNGEFDKSYTIEKDSNSNSQNLTLTNAMDNTYEVSLVYTDFAGNESAPYIVPKFALGYTVSGTPEYYNKDGNDNPIEVFFGEDKLVDYGLTTTAHMSDGSTEDASSIPVIPDIAKYTPGNISNVVCNYGGVAKKTTIYGSCYVAKKDAKPVEAVKKDPNYTGTYYFGNFPQSAASSSISGYSTKTFHNSWYLGSDGYFYEMVDTSYYKVEPIKWYKFNGVSGAVEADKTILLSAYILTYDQFNKTSGKKTVNGKGVYPNNYEYSNIRAYLNGINNYRENYVGNGFLQIAFTKKAQDEHITAYLVNNNNTNTAGSKYSCSNTTDKIFLIAQNDLNSMSKNNTAYASKICSKKSGTSKRIMLRSPSNPPRPSLENDDNYSGNYVVYVNTSSNVETDGMATATIGVVPAIKFLTSELPE